MEIGVVVALALASGVGPHYSPRFSTGASPPKAGGEVKLRGQRLDFLLECLFAGKSADQLLVHQKCEVSGLDNLLPPTQPQLHPNRLPKNTEVFLF